jgi:uncharacterized protein
MKPLYFGSSQRQLFGIYHPPRDASVGSRGVLLCYPGVQEYNGTHWAFRRLAAMLARKGLHVFRFDYFGTGDSAGELHEAALEDWIADIRQAAAEFVELSRCRSISVVGLRLGAALALRCVERGLAVKDLVLWEPLVLGRDYVRELEAWDRRRNIVLLHARRTRGHRDELLGFPFPPDMRRSLEEFDLAQVKAAGAERVLILVSEHDAPSRDLQRALESAGVSARIERSATDSSTPASAGPDERAVLSSSALVQMTSYLSDSA